MKIVIEESDAISSLKNARVFVSRQHFDDAIWYSNLILINEIVCF